MQLSCHLYMLFVDNFDLVKEIHSIDSVLEVIASTLNISQKRDPFQPHFTFLVDSLYQLSQSLDVNCNAELGLKVVLMTTPQAALLTMVFYNFRILIIILILLKSADLFLFFRMGKSFRSLYFGQSQLLFGQMNKSMIHWYQSFYGG